MYKQLRPPTAQIIKSIFSILKIKFSYLFENPIVLDLFAGSGTFGLMMISKSTNCYSIFVERNFSSCTKLNKLCRHKYSGKYKVIRSDAFRVNINMTFDIIFIDPPYLFDMSSKMLKMVEQQSWLKEETIVCLRKDTKEILVYDGKLEIIHEYIIGYNQILFFRLKKIQQI